MFPLEKDWIISQFKKINYSGGTALDVGSATKDYLKRQPYINDLGNYLKQRGTVIYSLDINPKSKASYIQDITSSNLEIEKQFDIVLCNNVLEHVEDISKARDNLVRLVSKGGFLIVTVPCKLPKHNCPIDNNYRPTNEQLEKLFPDMTRVSLGSWKDKHYREPFLSCRKASRPEVSGIVLYKNQE